MLTFIRIGIGIVHEFQNLQIGIGIIFVRWKVFLNYSQIPEIFSLSNFFLIFLFFLLLYIFCLKNLLGKQSHSEIYAYSLYILNIWIRYSWILWQIFVNWNNICQIIIFTNRNNINVMKLWQIGIGIYLSSKYQGIDLCRIYLRIICKLFAKYLRIIRKLFANYSQIICKLFANIELFADHCPKQKILGPLSTLNWYVQLGFDLRYKSFCRQKLLHFLEVLPW